MSDSTAPWWLLSSTALFPSADDKIQMSFEEVSSGAIRVTVPKKFGPYFDTVHVYDHGPIAWGQDNNTITFFLNSMVSSQMSKAAIVNIFKRVIFTHELKSTLISDGYLIYSIPTRADFFHPGVAPSTYFTKDPSSTGGVDPTTFPRWRFNDIKGISVGEDHSLMRFWRFFANENMGYKTDPENGEYVYHADITAMGISDFSQYLTAVDMTSILQKSLQDTTEHLALCRKTRDIWRVNKTCSGVMQTLLSVTVPQVRSNLLGTVRNQVEAARILEVSSEVKRQRTLKEVTVAETRYNVATQVVTEATTTQKSQNTFVEIDLESVCKATRKSTQYNAATFHLMCNH
jgi:hypothetical protein